MAVVEEPLHTTWLEGVVTVGVGLTVNVKIWDDPEQVRPPEV